MKKNICLALLLLLVAFMYACSPKASTGLIPATNLKHLGLKEKNIDRLDSLLGAALINQYTAQATALVAKNGEIIFNKNFGFRNRETKALATGNDAFRLGALSQPIVTLAALLLVQKGKLNLNDKVSKYIPEFLNPQIIRSFNEKDTTYTTQASLSDITILQLLNHTSGIGGLGNSPTEKIYEKNQIPLFASTHKDTIYTTVKKLATLPLAFAPNTQCFNGLNTDVLGAVIEQAAGLPLDSVITQSVLRPLGMANTYFFLPLAKSNLLTTVYSQLPNGRLQRSAINQKNIDLNYPIAGAKSYFSGATGLVSTANDYAKFLQMVLNKGMFNTKQIAEAHTIELMTQNQIGDLTTGENKFTFGFDLATNAPQKNNAKPNKLSRKGEFNTFFWIDTQRNTIALLFTQVYPSSSGQKLINDFERMVNEILDDVPLKKEASRKSNR
jgi:CubicO group peptidase (beta-lactamase class C family)